MVDLFGTKKKQQALEEERRRLDLERERSYLRENMKLCKKCKAVLPEGKKVCLSCGEVNA